MSPATTASSRWCPTPEQLMILEEMYRGGIKTPNSSQIQQITAHLSNYGKIEGKNVFYWFQNHKARDRQKLRKKLAKQLLLQQQQQQKQLLHNNNSPQTRNHQAVANFSASSIRSLPRVHPHYYNSAAAASLLPQGVIEGTSSWTISNGTWNIDNRGHGDTEMDKQAKMRLYNNHDGAWIIMIDNNNNMHGPLLSTPSSPKNYKPPLKTLDLFPTKATSLKNDPSL